MHSVAWSPDGRTLASWGAHDAVRLWDAVTGKQLHCLMGHKDYADTAAFSPDGRTVAVGTSNGVIRLWEVMTGQERRRFEGHQDRVVALAFSPDGRLLASGSPDTTGLLWDMRAFPAGGKAQEPDALWDALEGDAATACEAIRRLAASPDRATPFLRGKLRAVAAADPKHVERLVSDLNAGNYAARERASEELEEIGEPAAGALRKALAGKPSLEQRRRLEQLLERIEEPAKSPRQLRELRALEALERIGTLDARRILEAVADGVPEARLTREARSALRRLGP
jgi:hypothetical protein